jgi:4-hydroxy-2-oxoheptanedioate aldolase
VVENGAKSSLQGGLSSQDRSRFLIGDGPLYGGWCAIPDSFAAEIMGVAGFDWCCVDLQHGMAGDEILMPMLQGLGLSKTPTIVRVPWNEPAYIMRALDAGADGVLVPMVNDVAGARAAVGACRYAPQGFRSWGPTRAALHSGARAPHEVNTDVLCIIMIETLEAAEQLEEILAVPGIDGVFVGPSDLAVSLGFDPRGSMGPTYRDVIQRILHGCRDRRILSGIFCNDLDAVRTYRKMGFRLLAVQSDVRMLRSAAELALRELRGTDGPVSGTSPSRP